MVALPLSMNRVVGASLDGESALMYVAVRLRHIARAPLGQKRFKSASDMFPIRKYTSFRGDPFLFTEEEVRC
jgi:hypothetical protein